MLGKMTVTCVCDTKPNKKKCTQLELHHYSERLMKGLKYKKNIQNTCINVNVKISFFRERGGHRNVDPKSKALFMKYIASVQFLTVFDVIVNI